MKHNMRLRIMLLSFGITIVCVLFFLLAAANIYYQSAVNQSENYLKVYMNEFDSSYTRDENGAIDFSKKLNGARVTFLDLNGNVIADSSVGEIAENHLTRQEVRDAALNGEGFAIRSSKTLGKKMAYYCRKIDDNLLVRIAIYSDSEWRIFANLLPSLAYYIGIIILLCIGLAYAATYFILNPVKKLTKEASSGLEVSSQYAELLPIAKILNERNANLIRQMDEIKADKELLERERASKDEFISNVTHEMNTPLTSIKGYAELLSFGGMTEEQKQDSYKIIESQSERLSSLIACIINYSKIDDDDVPPYEVNLTALTRETVDVLRADAELNGIKLVEKLEDNVVVMSRHERLSEILGNLIRNAIKYNKKGGSVFVTLSGNQLIIEDTGIGIAEENLGKIFSRFFTVDKSHGGKNGGFGLGLAVVKKICLISGWKINVESKLGEGSKFTITF